jgi:hypothetical protein
MRVFWHGSQFAIRHSPFQKPGSPGVVDSPGIYAWANSPDDQSAGDKSAESPGDKSPGYLQRPVNGAWKAGA